MPAMQSAVFPGVVRALLPALLVGLQACSPSNAAPAAAPSGAPGAPGAPGDGATAAPSFDPTRADAALLGHLATLADPGPPLGGLSEACRSEVAAALATAPDADRAALARGDAVAAERHPILALAAGGRSQDALYFAGCGGGTSRELLSFRVSSALLDDLPGSVRRTALRAAAGYARGVLLASARGPLVSVAEADRLDEAGGTLRDARLRRLARERAAALEPTRARLARAALGAAWDLDAPAAGHFLEEARRAQPGAGAQPRAVEALMEAASLAANRSAALARLGGRGARGEAALEAAQIAAQLGRFDLLSPLVSGWGGAPGADLRAAVAGALGLLDGALCGGLEWSRESSELCPHAWLTSPDVREALALIERGYGSGKGRAPWALETYLGLHDVLPLSFGLLANQAGGAREASELMGRHLGPLRAGLRSDGAPAAPRAEALLLFIDVLDAAFSQSMGAEGAAMKLPPGGHAAIEGRAASLLQQHPGDPLVQRTALATAVALSSERDSTPLLSQIPADGELALTRAAVAAVVAQRYGRPDAARAARGILAAPPADAPAPAAFRARLLAAELLVMAQGNTHGPGAPGGRGATPGATEATEATGATGATEALQALEHAAREPPPDALSPLERLQRAIDQVGALSRRGKRAEAEALFAGVAQSLRGAPSGRAMRDVLALFEAEGLALLASAPDEASRRAAQARLLEKLDRPDPGLAAEVRLYRALWLEHLAAEQAAACKPREAACRAAAAAARSRASKEIEESQAQSLKANVPSTRAGIVSAGGSSHVALNFSVASGITAVIEVTPRLIVLPRPPASSSGISVGKHVR
jgi:hypothetical protein